MNHERKKILHLIEEYSEHVSEERKLMHDESKIDLEKQTEVEVYVKVIQDLRDLISIEGKGE